MTVKVNNGGPAFPIHVFAEDTIDGESYIESKGGMTLRDYFAAKALVLLSSHDSYLAAAKVADRDRVKVGDFVAQYAYEIADAMLKARQS